MSALAVAHTTGFRAHAIYLVAAIPLVIAIVVSLLVWRNARRERVSMTLRRALSDPDPAARRHALDQVTDDTLRAQAPLLVELVSQEQDPDVLDALAAAVARSRWEPTSDPALVELRRWVAGGQAQKTRSSAAGPATGTAQEAAPEPAAAAGEPAGAWRPVPPVDGAPSSDELAELVPKVRALLGERLERLELVSIDGEVLTRWTAEEAGSAEAQAPK